MIHPVDYAPSQDFGDNPTAHLPADHWIIQQFGNYQPDGHTGVDYPCPSGTPVKAVADGVVRHVGWMGGTYADNPWWIQPSFAGYLYVVDHGHFIGIYGHCQDGGARVRVGQQVAEGQVLGLSGNTGASTGPHLHFEVLPDGWNLFGPMYGRINPNRLLGRITAQGTTVTPPIKTKPKEWDEMASKEDIAAVVAETLTKWMQSANGKKIIRNAIGQTADAAMVREVLTTVQDIAKKSGTSVGAVDADAVVDAIAARLGEAGAK